jgi:hypothetical protein
MGARIFVRICALAVGAGALLAGSAMAAPSDADAKAKKRRDDPNRMVCRTIMPSGSRISTRHCRPQADWERDERETQDAALSQQTGPGYQPPNTGVVTGERPQ